MSAARSARRLAVLRQFCQNLNPLLGTRVSVEALSGSALAVMLDGGTAGTCAERVAPLIPKASLRRDLFLTVRAAAETVHALLTGEPWAGTTLLDDREPEVIQDGDVLRVVFFLGQEPRTIEVRLAT